MPHRQRSSRQPDRWDTSPPLPPAGGLKRIDTDRYRKVRWFFVKMLIGMIVFDVIFSLPVLRWFRPSGLPRWRKVSRRYREMAVEMGGILIKLGQFVSTRVDLLPPEVIQELAGLQDRVAPALFEAVVLQVEKDFGRPLSGIFPVFTPVPIGSASLAQAHEAELPDGTAVVVKVLRPGIDVLVATDLTVMEQVCRWLNRFSHIRSRMNLGQLMQEFTATTRRELDMTEEMAIGVGTRNARKVVQAYVTAGVLQPGVDTIRLEAAHEDWFNRVWGIRMGKFHEVAYEEARYFFNEYRDLITEIPFQLQEEMLFIGRAVGILAGMATQLDPEFDPWGKTIPYARQFAREELKLNWKDLPEEVLLLGRHLLKIPAALDQVLDKAGHGNLAIQVSLSPETRKAMVLRPD